jgi:hypothetical protein
MKKIARNIVLITIGTLLGITAFSQSYYPLDLGKSWTYDVTDYATSDTSRNDYAAMLSGKHNREEWGKAKVKFVIEKDSILNGKTYRVVANANGSEVKLIREENGNYFRFNNRTFKDDNFLKPNLKAGNIWLDYSNPDQTVATVYKVITIDKQKMIKGKMYNNVIAISEFTGSMEQIYALFTNKAAFPITKYYAENIGLIYNYMPYPLGGTYSDLEISLSKN